jgi:hypothetical protein
MPRASWLAIGGLPRAMDGRYLLVSPVPVLDRVQQGSNWVTGRCRLCGRTDGSKANDPSDLTNSVGSRCRDADAHAHSPVESLRFRLIGHDAQSLNRAYRNGDGLSRARLRGKRTRAPPHRAGSRRRPGDTPRAPLRSPQVDDPPKVGRLSELPFDGRTAVNGRHPRRTSPSCLPAYLLRVCETFETELSNGYYGAWLYAFCNS